MTNDQSAPQGEGTRATSVGKPFSILHISDLHRSPNDPISNAELISALISDRERYLHETPRIAAPEAIVVSGDIIQGVPLDTDDHEAKLAAQYAVAEEFLDELVRRFVEGDRSRLIMIPGNHDIDWNTAFKAMDPIARKDVPDNLASALHAENSEYRWDWKTLTLYRIRDTAMYEKRLETFWHFFEKFYSSVPNLLKVHARADANLFQLCNGRIGVAAYNSCHGNDCFAFHGMIRKDIVARSHLELDDTHKIFDLRMAVWHHSTEGPPYRTDYMDVDIVRGMIGRGFRLGLYGHQHKAHVAPHQVWLPDRERMAIVSAGSLCARASELPTGVFRQYNVLEIAEDFRSVCVHVRAMAVANLFSRGQLIDFGGASYATLDWNQPRNAVGGVINTGAARLRLALEEAELAAKSGDPARAVEVLCTHATPPGSYERQLLFASAVAAQEWTVIVAITNPPTSIEELIQRVEACNQLGDVSTATDSLNRYSKALQLHPSVEEDLRRRINAQEAIRQ
jgi:hypothetical protein